MKQILNLSLLAAIAVFSASCATSSIPRPTQRVLVDPLEYGYVVGHLDGNSQLLLNEFVRKGDSIKDWETLVTRMYARSGSPVSAASVLAKSTLDDLKRDCPHIKISMKKLSDSESVVEYSHNGCGSFEGHRSVRKFMAGREGVYMIAFDMKNKAYDASEFSRWRSRIISAQLSQ